MGVKSDLLEVTMAEDPDRADHHDNQDDSILKALVGMRAATDLGSMSRHAGKVGQSFPSAFI